MSYQFNNDMPIYLQVLEHIKMQIISKEYLPNQKLPSVREMSLIFEVNPNTIQKALAELEDMGLIYTERTNGKFVTNDLTIINNITKQTINNKIKDFFESMEKLGFNKQQILDLINKEWIYENFTSKKCT